MQVTKYLADQLGNAHRAFATRIADIGLAASLDLHARPAAGDLCLVRVTRLGQHRHIELVSGRRAALAVGDELIVAFGNRYASDQFEAIVPPTLAECHLVAGGGIAAMTLSRHASMKAPTDIQPLGILRDASGVALNLSRWGWPGVATPSNAPLQPHMILVVGTSMNAGKTTLCANVIRTLRECGLRASALKLTGTGSGGDLWKYQDSGALEAMDFGNVGLASTAGMDVRVLDAAIGRLCAAVSPQADVIVAELADGILQRETSQLLQASNLRSRAGSILFAASDPLGAVAGIQLLSSWGLDVSAVGGLMTASPLAVREFSAFCSTPVIFSGGALAQEISTHLFSPANGQSGKKHVAQR
ncbi:MAG: DUF1611 domain-containing protein [Hyphomonadaceae bacterium]